MTNKTYNGWSNVETWNINLTYENLFDCIADEERIKGSTVEEMAQSMQGLVEEIELETLKDGSLALLCVSQYLQQVNWLEIAEHRI